MAFPATLDTLTDPISTDKLNIIPHAELHVAENDAIEALQVKVGIDSSADTNSLDYRIAQLEAGGGGGGGATHRYEVPAGTVDGANVTFTITYTPVSGSLLLFYNGLLLKGGGNDYTLSSKTITFTEAPHAEALLFAVYLS